MKVTGFTIQETSQRGQSLLVSKEHRGCCPEVSIQLPTDVAEEILRRWNVVQSIEDRREKIKLNS